MTEEKGKETILEAIDEAAETVCAEDGSAVLGGTQVPVKKAGMKTLLKAAQVLGKNFGLFMDAIQDNMAGEGSAKVVAELLGGLADADLVGDMDRLLSILTGVDVIDIDYSPEEFIAFVKAWAIKNKDLKKTLGGFTDLGETFKTLLEIQELTPDTPTPS
ncbi:hypothetical protein OAF54_01220 [bacterium]|nr:hypothetical protein [bacterium]